MSPVGSPKWNGGNTQRAQRCPPPDHPDPPPALRTGTIVGYEMKENMPSTQQKFSIGYFILAFLGLFLIHTLFFAPQSENLSYRDFKTLLRAGKVADLSLGERTITGRLITDGLEGLLPSARLKEFRKVGQGEYRFL
jgi:hypothetical protein